MKFDGAFGTWLKQRRKSLDLTQQEVANQVGCAVITIRKIETEEYRPSKQIAERLADVLAVVPDDRDAFIRFARHVNGTLSAQVSATHNLPHQATAFIGRDRELAALTLRLEDPTCRLITVVGPGGIGKTRFALHAAERQIAAFQHGVFFVSLAPLQSPDAIVSNLAETLRFSFYGAGEPKQQLLDYLRGKHMLLVLDNFEHLLGGADLIAELLEIAPEVKILATSRARLNLQAEMVFALDGLTFPSQTLTDNAADYDAVKLFLQTAQQVQRDFAMPDHSLRFVIQICRLLEGMPLGILLAAAWASVLSVQEIAREIQHSLDFLETEQRDLPARQRSLRAAFEHSWKMLGDDERAVFRKLSVFRGGFAREAAQEIAGTSLALLMSLVNKSFLRRDTTSGRYEIHEALRQYGAEQLNQFPLESAHVRDAHCAYYASYTQRQLRPLMSRDQATVLDEIATEYNNILAAWELAIEKGLAWVFRAMTPSLWYFFDLRAPHQDAAELFGRAADALQALRVDAECEIALGLMQALQSWFLVIVPSGLEQIKTLIDQSLTTLRQHDCPQEMVFALVCSANFHSNFLRQAAEAEQLARESVYIARQHDTAWGLGSSLIQLTGACLIQQKYVEAKQFAQEGLIVGQSSGDVFVTAVVHQQLGELETKLGNYHEAANQFELSHHMFLEIEPEKPFHAALICEYLGKLTLLTQDYAATKTWLQRSVSNFQKAGHHGGNAIYEVLHTVAKLWVAQERQEDAIILLTLLQSEATIQYIRDLAAVSFHELSEALPENRYKTALERSQSLSLDGAIAEFLQDQ